MSRVGKRPITIPDKVKVALEGDVLDFKGPLGNLTVLCNARTTVHVERGIIRVEPKTEKDSPFQGLVHALIRNALEGVTKGFERKLEVVGVGYRAEVQNRTLKLFVGLSHPAVVSVPETVELAVEAPTSVGGVPVTAITVKGVDKELVGRVAAGIRATRPPEPYKGKGIKYSDEVIRRKAGKVAATV